MTVHSQPAIDTAIRRSFDNAAEATSPLRPAIANLIAQAHALGGQNKTATVGLLTELANDIRAGEARPGSRIAHHASRLHDATAPEALPVFLRAPRNRPACATPCCPNSAERDDLCLACAEDLSHRAVWGSGVPGVDQ